MKYTLILLTALLLAPLAPLHAAEALPRPDARLLPAGPPNWTMHPGGAGCPEWRERVEPHAPAIGFQTDMTFPDETIAVLGSGLDGASFVLWVEGMTFPVSALRTAEDRAQIVVPTQADGKPVPKSVMLLWPRKANGCGYPVRLNAPCLFWVWPGRKWANEADRTIRVFGKTLSLPGREPLVVAQRGDDKPVALKVTQETAYELKAELPVGYAAGDYSVWVHNGTGGVYGWSEAGRFTVAACTYDTATEFAVDEQPGASDQEKIVNAIAAAKTRGGGTVRFAARAYTLTADLAVPELKPGAPPVVLKGAGRDKTLLSAATPNPWTYRTLELAGPGSCIRDMKLDGVVIKVRAHDMTIDNIELIGGLSNWHDLMPGGFHPRQNLNLNVLNSVFRSNNACCSLGGASFIRFTGCQFFGRYCDGVRDQKGVVYGANHDNHGISLRGSHKVIVEQCRFQSEDPLHGKIMTRGIAMLHNDDSHHYFANNTFEWIGAFPSATKRDTNTGEVILYHGGIGGVSGTVEHADWDSVTIGVPVEQMKGFGSYAADPIGMGLVMVFVRTGRAAGQCRVLESAIADGPGKTRLKISGWQHVCPAAGDKVVARCFFRQHLILNNHIDSVPEPAKVKVDFNRTGVLLWCPTFDTVVAGNTIRHQREAIRIQSAGTYDGQYAQVMNHFRGNIIRDCLTCWPGSYSSFLAEVSGKCVQQEFYSVGEVFRDNVCQGADLGVAVGAAGHDRIPVSNPQDHNYQSSPRAGVVHTIVENNELKNVSGTVQRPDLGLAVGISANWTLLRNNKLDRQPNLDFYRPEKIFEAWCLQGGRRWTSTEPTKP